MFDRDGRTLWFTGQSGVFGRLDTQGGAMTVFDAPRGAGPFGIATCPDGEVYYASLAGSYVGRIQKETGGAVVLAPPTANQGARRVWCDSKSRVWVAEWSAGQLAVYWGENSIKHFDPAAQAWVGHAHPQPNANVRQLLGRPGEVWGAMSGQDKLVVARAP